MPTVRPALPTDAPVIADYNLRLARETEHRTLDPAVLARGVARVLADPARGLYFVAEQDGRVVGQLLLTYEWSDWRDGWIWWIQSVYVEASARRAGVFRSLYDHVRRSAEVDPEVVALRLYVERDNQAAQSTYGRLGMSATSYLVMERDPL